jgi:hypothetical protein
VKIHKMHEPDDQDWLEALAGRKARNENSAAANTGKALREAYLARPDQIPSSVEAPKPDFQKLLNRARAEGLLADQSERREGRFINRGYRRIQGLLALAASIVVTAGAIFLIRPPSPTETLRSPTNGTVRIENEQPEQLQQKMLVNFRALGVKATAYEQLGVEGIDTELPSPVDPKIRDMLRSYGIATPTGGDLDIQIVRKEAR